MTWHGWAWVLRQVLRAEYGRTILNFLQPLAQGSASMTGQVRSAC
jgi:hypothetical protein